MLESFDDLLLESLDFGQVGVHTLAVQLPQRGYDLIELATVERLEIFFLQDLLELLRLLDTFADFTTELPDVAGGDVTWTTANGVAGPGLVATLSFD